MLRRSFVVLGLLLAVALLAACGNSAPGEPVADNAGLPVVTVYKPPT